MGFVVYEGCLAPLTSYPSNTEIQIQKFPPEEVGFDTHISPELPGSPPGHLLFPPMGQSRALFSLLFHASVYAIAIPIFLASSPHETKK